MSIGAIGSEAGYYGYGSTRKSSEANDVMPTKATQAEMYAFFEHYDSVNGTENSYEKSMAYMCEELDSYIGDKLGSLDSVKDEKGVFREATDMKPEISYITCFTSEGIICREAGMGENEYLWKLDFEDEQDYEKVMNNPKDRIYNLQEFTELIANEIKENQKKLVDPNDEEALKRIAEDVIVCKG